LRNAPPPMSPPDFLLEETICPDPIESSAQKLNYRKSILRIHPRLPFFIFRVKRLGTNDCEFKIEISRGDDPKVRQTLRVTTPDPLQRELPEVKAEDFDFDGYQDIRISIGWYHRGIPYLYWKFDPATETFKSFAELSNLDDDILNNLTVDPARRHIHTCIYIFDWFVHRIHRWNNGRLELIGEERKYRREERLTEWLDRIFKRNPTYIHEVSELRNGKMTLIEKTTIK